MIPIDHPDFLEITEIVVSAAGFRFNGTPRTVSTIAALARVPGTADLIGELVYPGYLAMDSRGESAKTVRRSAQIVQDDLLLWFGQNPQDGLQDPIGDATEAFRYVQFNMNLQACINDAKQAMKDTAAKIGDFR